MGDFDNHRRQESGGELVLSPGEYANILDETKGNVAVYSGPAKASLSATDRPVRFDSVKRKFIGCSLSESIFSFAFAQKGSYIVLHNPVESGKLHPASGPNQLSELAYGNKINIEGPDTFALFPGQFADTIDGHRMRSNQYLIVRVYDEEAAKSNWDKATIKLQKKEGEEGEEVPEQEKVDAIEMPDLTMGRLLVIEGTKVSFYIPPTGIEVVTDESGNYVRDAVTLERLEYCILLDEDGNKRYVQGPDVVFPKPTETFTEKNSSRKFRAIELNKLMGIYIKVIADYEDGDKKYKTGDELFITGEDQKIYYPRPEHAIIKYDNNAVSYAIAIPDGEARYVLNRLTGEIKKRLGPDMFLPDPRTEVIVRRVLSDREVGLWFPGNTEAANYNAALGTIAKDIQEDMADARSSFIPERTLRTRSGKSSKKKSLSDGMDYESLGMTAAEEMKRKDKFTPPRTITIDTKFEGAVAIDVWPGYAVQVVSKTGDRRVIVGSQVHLLEYDETLEKLSFSTGTPKTDKRLQSDVYLRVKHNTISDIISVETRDLCPVEIMVSYRVNFENEPEKWFSTENPVKFLTDHLRSLLRNKVKQLGIEEFYNNSINIVRDTILGEHEDGTRPGRFLEENGMRVYDLEVLGVEIIDSHISSLLEESQHDAVRQRLLIEEKQRMLETTKETETISQEINTLKAKTQKEAIALQVENAEARLDRDLSELRVGTEVEIERTKANDVRIELENETAEKNLVLRDKKDRQILQIAALKLEQALQEMDADTKSVAEKAKAVSPHLIDALRSFADKDLAGKLAENFNVLSILGGKDKSIVDIASTLLNGTGLGDALKNIQLHGHLGDGVKKLTEKMKQ